MTGDFLKAKIKMSGYQQVEVAEALGISPQNLESKLKSNDIKVSFLLKVAKAINKNIYYFFDDIPEEKNFLDDSKPSNVADKNNHNAPEKADDFIINKIADVLANKIEPDFQKTDKNINALLEGQSRIIISQSELLDQIEEFIKTLKSINK